MASPYAGLDDAVRASLRTSFTSSVSTGSRMPLVIPYSLLGAFIVPTLWLSLSQRRHPWVYHTRWLVAAFVILFNLQVVGRTSSSNIAVAYATGLLCAWGIIYNMNLLIWTRPQVTAARIVRGKARNGVQQDMVGRQRGSLTSGSPGATLDDSFNDQRSTLRQRGAGHELKENGRHIKPNGLHNEPTKDAYVWQPFPHDAPWKERFNWAFDLTTSFRGCGWNWAISSIPQPKPPPHVDHETLVDIDSWPIETPAGYKRWTNESKFLRARLTTVFIVYMIIDYLAITMAMDPYFILGPDQRYDAPPHLAWLPSFLILWIRQLMSLVAVYAAISGMMTSHAVLQYCLVPYIFPSRDQLWHYPSINGNFSAVLDRGLAGWWGQWWHQTFRAQFLAPATYLLRQGYTRKGEALSTIVALAISFGQSGMLHGFGSFTSIPETRAWRAPLFFALQPIGLMLELALTAVLPSSIFGPGTESQKKASGLSGRGLVRQLCNFAFALMWVQWTSIFFCDDIASTGLWLCDPLPFSPLRMLGFGRPDDRWWRWEREHFPGWYTGDRWWQSGFAF